MTEWLHARFYDPHPPEPVDVVVGLVGLSACCRRCGENLVAAPAWLVAFHAQGGDLLRGWA